MNSTARKILMDRMNRPDYASYNRTESDYRRGDRGYDRGYDRDYDRDYDRRMDYGREWRNPYPMDSRRGYPDYGAEYRDRDYGEPDVAITPTEMRKWEMKIRNADGSKGFKWQEAQVVQIAKDMGVKFVEYDVTDLTAVVNMLYSDYCEVLKPYIPKSEEPLAYIRMAKAFLEDDDGLRGKEKLAVYYYGIVCDDEEDGRRRR